MSIQPDDQAIAFHAQHFERIGIDPVGEGRKPILVSLSISESDLPHKQSAGLAANFGAHAAELLAREVPDAETHTLLSDAADILWQYVIGWQPADAQRAAEMNQALARITELMDESLSKDGTDRAELAVFYGVNAAALALEAAVLGDRDFPPTRSIAGLTFTFFAIASLVFDPDKLAMVMLELEDAAKGS